MIEFVRRQVEGLLTGVEQAVGAVPLSVKDELLSKLGTQDGQVLAPVQRLVDDVSRTLTERLNGVRDLLTEKFIKQLHHRMFSDVWRWAGKFRTSPRNIGIDYELVVPAATRLASKTGSGDQTVDGIQGPAEASTGSGNVHVSNIAGEVRAQTGSGDVRANDLKSDVRLSAVACGSCDALDGAGCAQSVG